MEYLILAAALPLLAAVGTATCMAVLLLCIALRSGIVK